MHRDHFRPHQAHTEHVRRLTLNVFRTHVNATFQAQQGAGERRGYAVLACTGFSNNFGFPHTLREQRLAENLVSFMCATVQQILTLEIQRRVCAFGQVATFRQRCRTARIVFQQVGKFRLKCRIFLRTDERLFQLAQGGHQDLRDVHPAELTKIRVK